MDPPRTRSKIYIGNLPESVRKHELLMEFDKFGEGFAHLTYVDSRSAQDAIRLMDGVPFSGNRLR
ncbi:Splicing factor_ arginine/serine-rich 7, partial [Caligus rogercresseyi]